MMVNAGLPMETTLLVTAWLAVTLNTMLQLRKEFLSFNMALCFFTPVIFIIIPVLLDALKGEPIDLIAYAFIWLFLYVLMLSLTFSRQLLPDVNERMVHMMAMLTGYVLLLKFSITTVVIISPALLYILYLALSNKPAGVFTKITLYFLFLAMLVFLNLQTLETPARLIDGVDTHDNPAGHLTITDLVTFFFYCTIIFYMALYLVNLLYIVPVRIKSESKEAMYERVQRQVHLYSASVYDDQARPAVTAGLSVLVAGLFFLHYRCPLIQLEVLIEGWLFLLLSAYPFTKDYHPGLLPIGTNTDKNN